MAARSGQREGAEAFTVPAQVNQRRYEALRAYFAEGLSYAEAGERLGYTRWAMINLVRDYRAGKLELFEQLQLPGPVVADQVDHRPAGVAEPLPGLGIGQALGEVGAQRLVAALVHLRRHGERLRALPLPRSGCHIAFLPDVQLIRSAEGAARNLPIASRLSLSAVE